MLLSSIWGGNPTRRFIEWCSLLFLDKEDMIQKNAGVIASIPHVYFRVILTGNCRRNYPPPHDEIIDIYGKFVLVDNTGNFI